MNIEQANYTHESKINPTLKIANLLYITLKVGPFLLSYLHNSKFLARLNTSLLTSVYNVATSILRLTTVYQLKTGPFYLLPHYPVRYFKWFMLSYSPIIKKLFPTLLLVLNSILLVYCSGTFVYVFYLINSSGVVEPDNFIASLETAQAISFAVIGLLSLAYVIITTLRSVGNKK